MHFLKEGLDINICMFGLLFLISNYVSFMKQETVCTNRDSDSLNMEVELSHALLDI